MNITKRILIAGVLFIGCSTQASELTPVLQKHLTRDTARIVEDYVWDGTLALDPKKGSTDTISWNSFGLTPNQLDQLYRIFNHQYKAETSRAIAPYVDQDSASIVTDYLRDDYYGIQKAQEWTYFTPVTYTIPEQHIPKDTLIPVIPRTYIRGKIVGNRIVVTDTAGKQYLFKLAEDRKANLERVAIWPHNILSPALIARDFTGSHDQMERFMANIGYFSLHIDEVAKLQQKDPNALTLQEIETLEIWDLNLDYVVHDKAKKAE